MTGKGELRVSMLKRAGMTQRIDENRGDYFHVSRVAKSGRLHLVEFRIGDMTYRTHYSRGKAQSHRGRQISRFSIARRPQLYLGKAFVSTKMGVRGKTDAATRRRLTRTRYSGVGRPGRSFRQPVKTLCKTSVQKCYVSADRPQADMMHRRRVSWRGSRLPFPLTRVTRPKEQLLTNPIGSRNPCLI
jgi:hypothetical protein